MSEIFTRHPRTDEIPLLKNLWSSVFGSIGIESFFRLFLKPGLCLVVEQNGSLAAMGYLLPAGSITAATDGTGSDDGNNIKCAMIYSVGTLPEYRGLGLGTIIVNSLIELAGESGYDAVILCPSEDRLFEYYSNRTKLRDWFYVSEFIITGLPVVTPLVLPTEISISKYLAVREKLLEEVIHIKQEERHFRHQLDLCNELGGGLFRIGDSCVVVERQSSNVIWIKELLMPVKRETRHYSLVDDIDFANILASIAQIYPADEYWVRTPAKVGTGRRFGMLSLCGNIHELSAKSDFAPWYGMAFD